MKFTLVISEKVSLSSEYNRFRP